MGWGLFETVELILCHTEFVEGSFTGKGIWLFPVFCLCGIFDKKLIQFYRILTEEAVYAKVSCIDDCCAASSWRF